MHAQKLRAAAALVFIIAIASSMSSATIMALVLALPNVEPLSDGIELIEASMNKSRIPHALHTPHAPIYINGNGNFTAANGVSSGTGTEAEPYIIEGWAINASGANGIDIRNTDVHLVIRNCVIFGGKTNYNYGIYFYSVQNSTIYSVSAYNNYFGMYLCSSPNNILQYNVLDTNRYNFGVWAGYVAECYIDIDTTNTVNGKPIYYIVGDGGFDLDGSMDIGYLGLVSCDRVRLTNLTFAGNVQGVLLLNSSDITITNSTYHDNYYGIDLRASSNNSLVDCTSYNNTYGLYLASSTYNELRGFTYHNNSDAIYMSSASNNKFINSTCKDNAKGIYLHKASNNTFIDTTCYNSSEGIYLHKASNNTFIDTSCYDSSKGVYLRQSSNNTFTDTTCYDSSEGIYLRQSSDNVFINGVCYDCSYGIYLYRSSNNVFTSVDCHSNRYDGIHIETSSDNNALTYCNITDNLGYGLYIGNRTNYPCTGNWIHHNNLIDNTNQAHDGVESHWDAGFGGNYWYDYNGTDADGDGIGETPYNISGSVARDDFPLMEPVCIAPATYRPLAIAITYPWDIMSVSGNVTIKGTAHASGSESAAVYVKVDHEAWAMANGTTAWSLVWDTATVTKGRHTIYAHCYDGRNCSAIERVTVFVTMPIELTGPNLTIAINDNASYTNDTSVTLALYAENATHVCLSNDGANWSAWMSYAAQTNWTLLGYDGDKTVYLKGRNGPDVVGVAVDTIVLDTVAPVISALEVTRTTDVSYLDDTTVYANAMELNLGATPWTVAIYDIEDRFVTVLEPEGTHRLSVTWRPSETLPDGGYALIVTLRDEAGNTASSRVVVQVRNMDAVYRIRPAHNGTAYAQLGACINLTYTILNRGYTQDLMEFIVADKPPKWVVSIAPDYLSLRPNVSANVSASIYVPRYTGPGNYTVVIDCSGPKATQAVSIDIHVNRSYRPVVTSDTLKYTLPGHEVLVAMTVKNEGNTVDLIELSIGSSASWAHTIILNGTPIRTVSLAPNRSQELMLCLEVPYTASEGSYLIDISAMSVSGMDMSRSETCLECQVELPRLRFRHMGWPEHDVEAGKMVQFTMEIENYGNVSLSNVTVAMYINSRVARYPNEFEQLAAGSSTRPTFYWRAEPGRHTIEFAIRAAHDNVSYNVFPIYSSSKTYTLHGSGDAVLSGTLVHIYLFVAVVAFAIAVYLVKHRAPRRKRRQPKGAARVHDIVKINGEYLIDIDPGAPRKPQRNP